MASHNTVYTALCLTALILIAKCNEQVHHGPDSRYLTPADVEAESFVHFKPGTNYTDCYKPTDGDSIFKYSIKSMRESEGEIKFESLKGKLILIVNVATFCKLTADYPFLNDLAEKYKDKLEIVGFPTDQFFNVKYRLPC